jgi:branched-chain amino acid transport system permease protein
MKIIKTTSETRIISGILYRLPLAVVIFLLVLFLIIPLFTSGGVLLIFGKTWVIALFAISLDLIFGYTGLISLGHAAFFAAGAYTVAILMRNHITVSFWLVIPAAVLASAIMAAVLGVIALRTKGTYFMLITLAFSGMVNAAAMQWIKVTGGSNGLSAIPPPDFGFFTFKLTSFSSYYLTFILFAVGYLLIYIITKTAFGKALVGIKQNETRMRVSGYNTWLYKYVAFIIAGAFAGLAGAAFVFYNSFVSPDVATVTQSAMGLLMVIIGGPGTLFGAALGAGIITFLQFYTSTLIATRWPLVIGFVFIVVIMWFRSGIAPYINKLFDKLRTLYGSFTSRESS